MIQNPRSKPQNPNSKIFTFRNPTPHKKKHTNQDPKSNLKKNTHTHTRTKIPNPQSKIQVPISKFQNQTLKNNQDPKSNLKKNKKTKIQNQSPEIQNSRSKFQNPILTAIPLSGWSAMVSSQALLIIFPINLKRKPLQTPWCALPKPPDKDRNGNQNKLKSISQQWCLQWFPPRLSQASPPEPSAPNHFRPMNLTKKTPGKNKIIPWTGGLQWFLLRLSQASPPEPSQGNHFRPIKPSKN